MYSADETNKTQEKKTKMRKKNHRAFNECWQQMMSWILHCMNRQWEEQ